MSGEVFLTIDTIVLRGLHVDRHGLTEALEQALVEQLSLHPALTAADLPRVQTDIRLAPGFGARQLGQALARSLGDIILDGDAATPPGPETAPKGGRHA
jgi:hypothetical protein